MDDIRKLLPFVKPYWRRAAAALVLLTTLVLLDLSIPRLIQRIIDQGIAKHDQSVVIQTSALMLGLSVLSTLIAIGNNITSIQVGESMARLTSDATAVQRVTQVSLRIGTRAPLLMVGSLILMFNTRPSCRKTLPRRGWSRLLCAPISRGRGLKPPTKT